MPIYNINVRTRSHIADTLKVNRPDDDALRIEVARFIGQLLQDHPELLWADERWQIDVSEARGLTLYVVDISVFQSPAGESGPRAGIPTNDR
jgi:hypothetical protein